jgi:hypothetical protein
MKLVKLDADAGTLKPKLAVNKQLIVVRIIS